jgi:phosphate acetyltransferase
MWIDCIQQKAKDLSRTILLPEGYDDRVVEAAKRIQQLNIADVTVISNDEIPGVKTIKPGDGSLKEAVAMIAEGKYDGMVAGAVNTTGDVVRAAIRKIGVDPCVPMVSSFFLMESDNKSIGENGGILFADCAILPSPDASKLANIAYATAQNARKIMGWEPRVAFLSFSTKGSASHESIDKVREAMEILEKKNSDFIFDGELQLDAAIIPEIAQKKDPDGLLKGKANILIFPDLNSANIGYKIAQRIGGMRAIGPVLQGFKKPVNDLSRGCSVADIIDVAAFTVLQAS